MDCPRCREPLKWSSDFMCDEVYDCPCGEGIVSYYECPSCNVKVELTTDCKGEKEENK